MWLATKIQPLISTWDKSEYFSWLYATVEGFNLGWWNHTVHALDSVILLDFITQSDGIAYDYVMVHYRNWVF